MIIVMALALALFVVYGLPQVDYGEFFNGEGFMTRGIFGLLSAGTLLTWATAGGIDMVNLSAECKNPTRDLPQVIVVTTAAIAILYALIGVVAAGIRRWKTLSTSLWALSRPLYCLDGCICSSYSAARCWRWLQL